MAEVNTNPNTAEANGGGDPQISTADTSTNEGAAKTFTQAEVNEIVKQRLDRQKKDIPTKEELDAFRKWQDGQKTAEQLSAEKLAAAENGKADAEKRAAMAEARYIALSHGIDKDAVDDVIALAMGKVSDSVTIEQAIASIAEKYPAFSGGITTGVEFSNHGGSDLSGVEVAFMKKNPGIKI